MTHSEKVMMAGSRSQTYRAKTSPISQLWPGAGILFGRKKC